MASKPVLNEGEITAKLQAASDGLSDLSQSIRTGMIDVRVLVEFREAMEHARRAAAAVQKWIEEETRKGGDPFTVVHMMAAERTRNLTQLAKELARDAESGDVDFDTPGLKELCAAVKTLNERLGRFG